MDEHKKEDVLDSSTVSGSEHVDSGGGGSGKAKVGESGATEVQLEGSTDEGKAEAAESCNGVVSSDIVDGDGEGGSNSSKGAVGGHGGAVKDGLAREGKILDGKVSETEAGGQSVVAESEEKKLVEGGEGDKEANCPLGGGRDLESDSKAGVPSVVKESKEGVEATESKKEADDSVGAGSDLGAQKEVGAPSLVVDSKGGLVQTLESGTKARGDLGAQGEVRGPSMLAEPKEEKLVEGREENKEANGVGDINLETECEVGGASAVEESKGGNLFGGEEGVKEASSADGAAVSDAVDDKALQGVGDASSRAIGSGVGDSMLVMSSNYEKIQAVAKESVEEGGLAKDGERDVVNLAEDLSNREVGRSENEETDGCGREAHQHSETKKVDVSHNEVQNDATEAASIASSTIPKESSPSTKVVEEGAIPKAGNDPLVLDKETDGSGRDTLQGSETKEVNVLRNEVHNSAEEGVMVMGGDEGLDPMDVVEEANVSEGNALQCSETKEIDVLHNEKPNHGTQIASVTASTVVKDSSPENKVVEERTVGMAGNEGSDPIVQVPGTNAMEGTPGGISLGRIVSSSDGDSVSTEKDGIAEKPSNSLAEQNQVSFEGRVASIDAEDIACPNIEGMDSDAFHENFCFSVEELQATVETDNGSTENHFDAFADQQSLYQPTQVVVGVEAASKQDRERWSLANAPKLTVAECLDQGVAGGSQLHLPTEQEKVEPQNENTEKVTSLTFNSEIQEHSIKDKQLKPEECVGKSAACGLDHADSNIRQPIKFQGQVTHAEKLGGNEEKVGLPNSSVETMCMSRETDAQVMDVKGNAVKGDEGALNPNAGFKVATNNIQQFKVGGGLDKTTASKFAEIDSNGGPDLTVEEHADSHEGQKMEIEEDIGGEQPRIMGERSVKWAALMVDSSENTHQASYQLPPDNEVEFSVSDLVWGKVRSHPWWPGQIFDPSDASEKAMKYHKKDSFLVAYFGDKTFAWNEASLLKPFRSHFSQVEKLSSSETFQNAVDCALEEVSRRVELGLTCSCVPKDTYDEIKFQVVENAGIRQESSTRAGVDQSTSVDSFEPEKLLGYVRELAQSAVCGADRVQLVIAKSQLLAFYRLKGYGWLPEFQYFGELKNAEALNFEESVCENSCPFYMDDVQSSISQTKSYRKRKHNLKDIFYPRKRERHLSELMGDSWDSVDDEIGSDGKSLLLSPSSDRKHKGTDPVADDSSTPEGRKTISFAKVSTSKPTFKIGECIRRVASQMTGSPSILKGGTQKLDGTSDGVTGDAPDPSLQQLEDAEIKRMIVPAEHSSPEELLSELHLAAMNPLKGYSFFRTIISFFSDFRNSVTVDQHDKVGGKRKKASQCFGGSPETFEFEDMNDTYWRDRVIENGSEEQPARKSRKRDGLFVPVILDKPLGRSNSRKRHPESNYDVAEQKPVGYVDENAPAELVMHFPVVDSVPSETNLNKMFKSFGPLKESETEIDRDTNRARVVFKRCSDAEAAYSSAPRFNIFGSLLVNYQLNYVISVPFKTPQLAIAHDEEDATLFLQY